MCKLIRIVRLVALAMVYRKLTQIKNSDEQGKSMCHANGSMTDVKWDLQQ
jgi:hypothetical protein